MQVADGERCRREHAEGGIMKTTPPIPAGGRYGDWLNDIRKRGQVTAIELADEAPSRGFKPSMLGRMVYYCRMMNLLKDDAWSEHHGK